MDSYGTAALFRSPRHDSFNRKLADEIARWHPKAGLFGVSSNIHEQSKELPGSWMRQSLARVKGNGP
jgi:hypothetical protein